MSTIETKSSVIKPSTACCHSHLKPKQGLAHYRLVEGSRPTELCPQIYSNYILNKMILATDEKYILVIVECGTNGCYERGPPIPCTIAKVCLADKDTYLMTTCQRTICRKRNTSYFYDPSHWQFIGNLSD
jgi:hypothetical protein